MENIFQLMVQDTKLTPDKTDDLYYWKYEYIIKLLNKRNKEQQEENKDNNKQGSIDPSSYLSKISSNIPKLPKK
jgi:hypothetical protein